MKYVRFIVVCNNGKDIELARSYRNSAKLPSMPFTAKVSIPGVSEVRADWCTKDEKYRIWRRSDHAMYEPLITSLEEYGQWTK